LYINYRGFVDGMEVIKTRFEVGEKNKSRKFYSLLKIFLQDLVDALHKKFPNLDQEVKRLF
jgi:hypothetical protein